jgi:hypothetical protein
VKRFIACVLATGGLVAAVDTGTALAVGPSITASSISQPANGSVLFYNGDSGSGATEVDGTVTGAGDGSVADLLCYDRSDNETFKLADDVDVSSGSYAADVSLRPIAGRACRLRLVPGGFGVSPPTGDAVAPFTGPAVSVSNQFSHSSNGNLWGYDVLSGTLPSAFELQSLGECPVLSSFITDPSTLASFPLFNGNACLPRQSGIAPNINGRSAVQVDGVNAYPPAAVKQLSGTAGFLPLGYSANFSPSHDEVTITETDPLMVCAAPGTYPPTSSTCPRLLSAGLQMSSTTSLLDGGTVARVDQTLTNTDSRPHQVDLLFAQSVTSQASGQVPGFEFPGQTSFVGHEAPDSFSAFPAGPSSIVVVSDSGAQPSATNPIGSITYNRPPASADFVSGNGDSVATFLMHYTDTLQPNATVAYDWSFVQSVSTDGLSSLEQIERDRFATPQVTIKHPARGGTTRHRKLTVSGAASDSVGLASLTVNAKPVTVSNGLYSTSVRLKPGKNTITVKATNQAGNSATASVNVTYKPLPCTVPQLRGKTLRAARAALRRHGCGVGRTITVRSRQIRKGRIVGTRPKAGSKHEPFTKVRLYVSRGHRRGAHAAAAPDAAFGL